MAAVLYEKNGYSIMKEENHDYIMHRRKKAMFWGTTRQRILYGQPIINNWQRSEDVPVTTMESDVLSKDLKKRGMTFVGSTIIYAYMQAVGLVNDHLADC